MEGKCLANMKQNNHWKAHGTSPVLIIQGHKQLTWEFQKPLMANKIFLRREHGAARECKQHIMYNTM